jgi:hypothetical protein
VKSGGGKGEGGVVANPNGRKGSSWEKTVSDYLNVRGFHYAERRAKRGVNDAGDIAGIPGVMIEAKAVKTITLSDFMDEVRVEKANAHAHIGACVIKRRNHGVDRAYVVMEFKDWVDLIKDE